MEIITLDTLVEGIDRPVDLVQMDIQGLELAVLNRGATSIEAGNVGTFLIGTQNTRLHQGCMDFLKARGYRITFEDGNTREQPDGIIVATR